MRHRTLAVARTVSSAPPDTAVGRAATRIAHLNVGEILDQVFQIAGAILILSAYGAAQMKMLDQTSTTYQVLNLVGSGILAVLAWNDRQWGFVMLEGSWALLSIWGLYAKLRKRRDRESTPGI